MSSGLGPRAINKVIADYQAAHQWNLAAFRAAFGKIAPPRHANRP
jgi:hypothetical protein